MYVALSVAELWKELVLKSKITPEVIFKDNRILKFQGETHANNKVENIIHQEKYDYSIKKVLRTLDCNWFLKEVEEYNNRSLVTKSIDREKAKKTLSRAKHESVNLVKIFTKLERILNQKNRRFHTKN